VHGIFCGTLRWLYEPDGPGDAAETDVFNRDGSRHRRADRSCADDPHKVLCDAETFTKAQAIPRALTVRRRLIGLLMA
jgi:hypothetical protein